MAKYTLNVLRCSHKSHFLIRSSLLLLLETSLVVNFSPFTQSVKISSEKNEKARSKRKHVKRLIYQEKY